MTRPAPDGAEALDAVIDALAARAARGERVAILWDMDGTLVDTRLRMLSAVHAYGRTDVTVDEVSPSWQETAERLGLDAPRFSTVWQRVFWAYESFDADTEIEATASRARRAEELGIQTIIVTGRIEDLRPVTQRQLDRLRLKPSRVFLKSTTGDITPAVKAEVIARLADEGLTLGAFVTDSCEEIQAAFGENVTARVPGLACVFVDVIGGSSIVPPEGASRFTVPVEARRHGPHGLVYAANAPRGPLQFGFEAEYEIDEADALLMLYVPDEMGADDWRARGAAGRAAWVRAQFPVPHSEDFDLAVRRAAVDPALAFMPGKLIIDSDGNVEVISAPVDRLDELVRQMDTLEHHCGPPLWQATLSAPIETTFGDAARAKAFDGFLTFHHLLDTFERMAVGHAMWREDEGREVLLPFLHPWLGPVTRGKHRFLRMYLEANPSGDKLDEKWIRLVKRAFSSFKYVGGSAYRPGLAGPDRVAVEVRDGHRNKALLIERLVRNAAAFASGLEAFTAWSDVWMFDEVADYAKLPESVRSLLEAAIPSQERADIAHMYSKYDVIALQVYRHFALPAKDWSDVERVAGAMPQLPAAQHAYLARLEALARQWKGGQVPIDRARRAVQGALAAFAVESGIHARLEEWRRQSALETGRTDVEEAVRGLLPLAGVYARTAGTGRLARRLERLAARWPENVRLERDAAVDTRYGSVKRSGVLLSARDLDDEAAERLADELRDALGSDTVSLRATDRGGVEAVVGRAVIAPHAPAREAERYAPRPGALEAVVALSPLDAHALRRHLAAHDPCWHAARRVSASGWVRHLRIGAALEHALGLPPPPPIETAAQVVDRVLASESGRVAAVVQWVDDLPSDPALRIAARPSTIASGFPSSLRRSPALPQRLEAFVARWPRNAKLIDGVPFKFGNGEQKRRVLVIALEGLGDAEQERLRVDYLDTVGADTISFPLREAADHLRTRIGTLAFAVSQDGVRTDEYQAPSGRRRIEAMLALTDAEISKLRRYAGDVLEDTLGMLGPLTLGGGTRTTTSKPEDNRPTDGGRHNCTTWVTLAPIGDGGEDLATLAQMPAHWSSHDNPGWWSTFLTGASRSERARFVVYWTDRTLDAEPLGAGEPLAWNFNPK